MNSVFKRNSFALTCSDSRTSKTYCNFSHLPNQQAYEEAVLPSLAAPPSLAGPVASSSSSASPKSLETQGRFAVDFPAPSGVMLSVNSVLVLPVMCCYIVACLTVNNKQPFSQLGKTVQLPFNWQGTFLTDDWSVKW